MSTHFNIQQLEKLKAAGKIRGYNSLQSVEGKKHQRVFRDNTKSKAKEWLSWNLPYWCNDHTVVLETEFAFHPARKWRFDWAIPSLKIAVEYEGIFADKSRHTTFKGYNADADKYNTAAVMGWRVIRLTALNYTNVLEQLNEMMK